MQVYLLDDGGTEQLLNQADVAWRDEAMLRAKRIKGIATSYGEHYLTQKNIYVKAGNLNNAMSLTQGEFIVVLGCDHVPAEDFIERILGFFQRDTQPFLLQTPHNFVTPKPL